MKLLITGFVPFGDNKENPSEICLNELKKEYETLLLPVSLEKAPKLLLEKINTYQPTHIISLGLASNRLHISLELIGINYLKFSLPDNDGITIKGKKINAELNDGIITNININNLIDLLGKNDIKTYLSSTAGTYICNLIYFTALNYTRNSLFIHLPTIDNSTIVEDLKAIKLIIENL